MSEHDEAIRAALGQVEHATAPSHDDDAYHEAAHSIAVDALKNDWFCPHCNPCLGDGNTRCRKPAARAALKEPSRG